MPCLSRMCTQHRTRTRTIKIISNGLFPVSSETFPNMSEDAPTKRSILLSSTPAVAMIFLAASALTGSFKNWGTFDLFCYVLC